MFRAGIGLRLNVGDKLCKGCDPFLLQAVIFGAEVAIDLGVARIMATIRAKNILREQVLRIRPFSLQL